MEVWLLYSPEINTFRWGRIDGVHYKKAYIILTLSVFQFLVTLDEILPEDTYAMTLGFCICHTCYLDFK